MARRYHCVDEELFLRLPGGSHEEPLPGPGPEVPTVTQPTTFSQDARATAIQAMEGLVRRQLLVCPWSPPLELLQEVRASVQRPCTGLSPLFLVGMDPCHPDPVEQRQRSPSREVHGQLLIDLEGVGVGAMEGPVPLPFPPPRRRTSPVPSEVQWVYFRGAWEGPDRSLSQRRSPRHTGSTWRQHRWRRRGASSSAASLETSSGSSDGSLRMEWYQVPRFYKSARGMEAETCPQRFIPPWDW